MVSQIILENVCEIAERPSNHNFIERLINL